MYYSQDFLPEVTVTELIFQVYQSGILTQEHRKKIKNLFLYHNLSEEDNTSINRLLRAIRCGWLKML